MGLRDHINYIDSCSEYRDIFITISNIIDIYVFKISTNPVAILGKDGWMFCTNEQSISDYRGIEKMDEGTLSRKIKFLEDKKDFFNKENITFYVVVAPDKHSIYPEFLPSVYNQLENRTRLDQFLNYSSNNSNLTIIDLRPSLIKAKNESILYWKTDTHWNGYGSFIGYKKITDVIKKDFPNINILDINNYSLKKESSHFCGDLCGERLYLLSDEYNISLENKNIADDSEERPNLYLYGDSFSYELTGFFNNDFNLTYFHRRPDAKDFNETLVLDSRPKIVVFETVERYIQYIGT